MSYEGYEEYLCIEGHYHRTDSVYRAAPLLCPTCNGPFKWWHAVDQTNGFEKGNPATYPAKVKQIGFTDIWKADHYGNRYVVKIMCYEPPKRGSVWRPGS